MSERIRWRVRPAMKTDIPARHPCHPVTGPGTVSLCGHRSAIRNYCRARGTDRPDSFNGALSLQRHDDLCKERALRKQIGLGTVLRDIVAVTDRIQKEEPLAVPAGVWAQLMVNNFLLTFNTHRRIDLAAKRRSAPQSRSLHPAFGFTSSIDRVACSRFLTSLSKSCILTGFWK